MVKLGVMSKARPRKRVLFVCTQNRVRSLTAEQVYRGRPDLDVRSAGIAENASVPLTQDLFEWADQVFVFSKRQREIIRKRFGDSAAAKPMVCLHLPDRFEYKSPKLIVKLAVKLGPYLGQPSNHEGAPDRDSSVPPVPEKADAEPKRLAAAGPGQSVFNVLNSVLFGVMVLPLIAGSVLLSPVIGGIP